jgi:hypothetical protein
MKKYSLCLLVAGLLAAICYGEIAYGQSGVFALGSCSTASVRLEGVEEKPALTVFPNPFKPAANIVFDIPAPGITAELAVYSINGRKVHVFTRKETGSGRAVWSTGGAASGLYVVRLKLGNRLHTRTILLCR